MKFLPEDRTNRYLVVTVIISVIFHIFIGIGLMWVLTPTRHSEPAIGHDHAATSVPGDQVSAMHLH